MKVLFLVAWLVGITILTVISLNSIGLKKQLRLFTHKQRKRNASFKELILSIIEKENEKESNYKLNVLLKSAGSPFQLDVFRFRLTQILAPLMAWLVISVYYAIHNLKKGYMEYPIIPLIIATILFYFLPYILLVIIARNRKNALSREIIKFAQRMIISINSESNLYYVVERSGRTTHLLKPYITDMLKEWSMKDPKTAIMNFGRNVGINEILPIVNTLLATWNTPKEKVVDLFHKQIRNIDTIRDFQEKKQIELSPLIAIMIIMVPFGVSVGLVILPWYRQIIDMFRSTF